MSNLITPLDVNLIRKRVFVNQFHSAEKIKENDYFILMLHKHSTTEQRVNKLLLLEGVTATGSGVSVMSHVRVNYRLRVITQRQLITCTIRPHWTASGS